MRKLTKSRMIILIAAVIIISVLSVVTSLSLFRSIESLLVEEKGKMAMSVSVAAAKLIEQDYASFEALLQAPDYESGSYDAVYHARMQQIFYDIREKSEVKFLYCGKRISEEGMVYLFDGEDPDSDLFSPLGSEDNLDEIELRIYNGRVPGYTCIINDPDWGELLTGMTPVIDPATGEVTAHVGADVSVTSVHLALDQIKRSILINALLLVIITSLIIYRLLRMSSIFTETDYLTGLRNKGYQDRFLAQQIKKSTGSGKQFPLIMIDFDDFKMINDRYGHQFGDQVLKSVSDIIRTGTRSMDCCARYGGDEFVIILPEANLEYTALICQWLHQEVSGLRLQTKGGEAASFSISIGVALWEPGMTAEELLIRADKALYHSKRMGKNKTSFYGQDLVAPEELRSPEAPETLAAPEQAE